jgi:hypothetical protein
VRRQQGERGSLEIVDPTQREQAGQQHELHQRLLTQPPALFVQAVEELEARRGRHADEHRADAEQHGPARGLRQEVREGDQEDRCQQRGDQDARREHLREQDAELLVLAFEAVLGHEAPERG